MLSRVLGIITIILCTTIAFIQHEYKKAISYYSIGQMGFTWLCIGASSVFLSSGGEYLALSIIAFSADLF